MDIHCIQVFNVMVLDLCARGIEAVLDSLNHRYHRIQLSMLSLAHSLDATHVHTTSVLLMPLFLLFNFILPNTVSKKRRCASAEYITVFAVYSTSLFTFSSVVFINSPDPPIGMYF